MSVQLNHHIVHARDPERAARWLADILGLDEPTTWGPFHIVQTANDVGIDFMATDDERDLVPKHYAFLVSEEEFDEIFGRITEQGLEFWADSGQNQSGQINHHDGGRGVYWCDPDGNLLEMITRPYGSGR